MFSKRSSLLITKGKPLTARQQVTEVKASSTDQYLKANKFEKSEQGGSSSCNFIYGATAVQGFRTRMQDDCACTASLTIKGNAYGYFGVFDGHGEQGEVVSQFCADHILKQLLGRKAMRQSKVITNELLAASMHKTLIKLDSQLRLVEGETRTTQLGYSGTTACMVLISQDNIMFVNVGDSRAVLCRDGGVAFETKDHNPDVPEEEQRVTAAGGKVYTTPSKQKVITDKDGYNNLCVSRSIGDFNFKPLDPSLPPELQAVTAAPDINVVERDHVNDEFLVIASDGIYKSLSSVKVVQFVQRQLMISEDLTEICRNLIDTAYYAAGNIPDDTTVILLKFSSAPSVSQYAVQEESVLELEAMAAIEQELKEMIEKADIIKAVDNDFNIIQRLVDKLPEKYRVQQRVPFILELTACLRDEKFGKKADSKTLQEIMPSHKGTADTTCTTNNTTKESTSERTKRRDSSESATSNCTENDQTAH